MPFDQEGNILLPTTSVPHELWPMLLTKALLKVAALELVTSYSMSADTFILMTDCGRLTISILTLSLRIPLRLYTLPCWSNLHF